MKRTCVRILVLALLVIIIPAPVAEGQGQAKVEVCHITDVYDFGKGDQAFGHVISIALPALSDHEGHGDLLDWEEAILPDGRTVCRAVTEAGECPCWEGEVLSAFRPDDMFPSGVELYWDCSVTGPDPVGVSSVLALGDGTPWLVYRVYSYDEPPGYCDHAHYTLDVGEGHAVGAALESLEDITTCWTEVETVRQQFEAQCALP